MVVVITSELKDKDTNPEDKAMQKFIVLRAFPVTICVHECPSQVTNPPSISTTCTIGGELLYLKGRKVHTT
jgi:hypothetical protein